MHMQEHQHPNAEQTLATQDAENLEFLGKTWFLDLLLTLLQTRDITSPSSVQKQTHHEAKKWLHMPRMQISNANQRRHS